MNEKPLKTYLFEPFRLDLQKGYLYREDGEEVELTATPRKILEYMLENTGEQGDTLFTRDKIIGGVWGNVAVESATLDKHIAALRKAFGRGERDQSVIETKHREGYRFKLPVKRIYGEANTESAGAVTAPIAAPYVVTAPTAVPHEISHLRPIADTFGLWLLGRGGGTILLLIVVLVAATVAASTLYRTCVALAQTIASAGQCIVIFVLFLHSLLKRPRGLSLNPNSAELAEAGYNDVEEYTAEQPILQKATRQFTKWWSAMLLSWVALYLVYAWETWGIDCSANASSQPASILEAILNIVNTSLVILCYDVLNKEPGRRRKSGIFTGPAAIGLALLAVIPLLSGLRVLTPDQGLAAFTLLTGLYAGIYMALFVARLQSKFLDPAPLLVVLLFSYTAIQPLALYIQTSKEWAWVVLDYALVLKCLLYLYVLWLIQSGDLLFYFREVKRNYDDRVDQRRRAHRRLIN
jgi:DNA-binding winged helix-turn-helix (wHTH) protein